MKKITLLLLLNILFIASSMAADQTVIIKNYTDRTISFMAMQRSDTRSGDGKGSSAHKCMRTDPKQDRWGIKSIPAHDNLELRVRTDEEFFDCAYKTRHQWYWFKPMGKHSIRFKFSHSNWEFWAPSKDNPTRKDELWIDTSKARNPGGQQKKIVICYYRDTDDDGSCKAAA